MAVSSLDDIEGLIDVLKDLGAAHSSHGLNDTYFDVSLIYSETSSFQWTLAMSERTIDSMKLATAYACYDA